MKKPNKKAPRMVLSSVMGALILASPHVFADGDVSDKSETISLSKVIFVENTDQAKQVLSQYEAAIERNEQQQKACLRSCNALVDEGNSFKQRKKEFIKTNGLPLVSILGGPGYVPETGLMLAVGGLYSFSTDRSSKSLQRSSFSLVAIGNEMESGVGFGLRSKQNLYFNDNDIRYVGRLSFGNQSQYYWGVGYETGKAQGASDSISMDYRFVNYDAELTFKAQNDWYIGPVLRLRYYDPNSEDLPLSALTDPNFEQYRDKPLSLGVGLTVQYDTRDVAVNAWSGMFLGLEATDYNKVIGSDNSYSKASVDYRYYYPISKGKVLALFNKLQWSQGDVPYYDLPTLGGQDSMRGIYQGRYRDNVTIENTVEYRWTLQDEQGYLTKHGLAFWAGLGSVEATINALYSNVLFSYGAGYRYEIQPRMNVRVDLGIGSNDDKGFYLTFTEAF